MPRAGVEAAIRLHERLDRGPHRPRRHRARWCSTVTGACSQRPTQGASEHAHLGAEQPGSFSISARTGQSHDSPLHTRSVSLGRGALRVLAHDVEVVVEARDLVNLDLRELEQLRQRREVAGAQLPEAIVQRVQVLDQQITPQRQRTSVARTSSSVCGVGRAAGQACPLAARQFRADVFQRNRGRIMSAEGTAGIRGTICSGFQRTSDCDPNGTSARPAARASTPARCSCCSPACRTADRWPTPRAAPASRTATPGGW